MNCSVKLGAVSLACLSATILLTLCLFSGCGSKGPKIVPVSGKVTLDGKPLPNGHIRFIPTGDRPAYGEIQSDGSFRLETDDKVGCAVGTHKVTVDAQAVTGTEATGETARQLTPIRYSSAETTEITVTIDGPRDDVLIELTTKPKAGS